jgi:hypothetical protein
VTVEERRVAARAGESAFPISTLMHLAPEGLVLGSGTLVVAADAARRLSSLKGQEARVLALLSAAYNRAVPPSVLGNIERAAKSWREGDDSLAYIHLAHAGLPELQDPRAAARRLCLADGLMKAGGKPRAIFEILDLDHTSLDALEKRYNPGQPRVPAGSGRISGRWTRILLWLGELNAAQVAELGAYATRVLGPAGAAAGAFGLLFIPSPNKVRVEGQVPEIPGLRYSWNRDETLLHLTYDDPDGGQRTFLAYLDGDVFRDEHGRVIGRVLPGNKVAIDAAAVSPDLLKKNEPRLCPAPAPDIPGSDRGKPYQEDRARQCEDFVKQFINPPPAGPTPSGFVYYLPNPKEKRQAGYLRRLSESDQYIVRNQGDWVRGNLEVRPRRGLGYETFSRPVRPASCGEWWTAYCLDFCRVGSRALCAQAL